MGERTMTEGSKRVLLIALVLFGLLLFVGSFNGNARVGRYNEVPLREVPELVWSLRVLSVGLVIGGCAGLRRSSCT